MSDENKYCIPWPEPQTYSVPLPFGGALTAIADPSRGLPTDCTLVHSLMLQLSPMLAGMTCLLRVLAVIQALKNAVSSTPPLADVGDLLDKIGKLSECFGMLDPCNMIHMVVAILKMILAYLNCMIEALESILHFQAGLDFSAAAGNPVMLANLECAQDNSRRALKGMNDSMQGVMPLIEMVNMLLDIVGQAPITLPSPTTPTLAGESDPLAPVITVRDTLQQAVMTLSAICP